MASQTIKGMTIQISGDTTKLGAAVKDAENKSKSLGKELSEVNRLLKEPDANAVELLAQKQQILTERISATKEKLDTLKAAQASVQAQFDKGDITAEQYRAFQREIQYTANAMQGYENAIQQTTKQLAEAKVKTGEEASSLDMLKAKISLQEQELSKLTDQYKSVIIAEGENSETAKELKDKYNQLNSELSESKKKMADAETAAASLGQAEEAALSPMDSLKKTISEQEKELSVLKDEYKNVVMEQGKDSDVARQLESQFDSLNQELQANQQKLNDVEQEANQLGQAEKNVLTPLESLKKSVADQEKELDRLNTEYQNAVVQYGKNSDEVKALASQIQKLSDEHKEQKSRLEEAENATKGITATEKTLTEQYKYQKSELDNLKKQYVNVAAQYGENSKEAKALAKQIDSLSGELAEEDKKIKQAETSADKFDKTLSDTSKNADKASDHVKDLGDSAKDAESGFNAATVAVGEFMGNLALELLQRATELIKNFASGTVETGKTFEASMSKVKAISGATSEELADLDAVARQYGRDTQFSASECADALSYMALAGWDVEDMTTALPGVLNLAAASEMDLAKASDVVTDYMTAFGWEANRAGEFADKMAFAMANSNTDTEMLGEAYKNCAATAESLHYSMEETTAAIMTMANAGVKGGESGTALNAVMTRLATDTKGCASSLAEYGVSIYDEQGNMQSLSSILTGISGIWGNLTDEQQANLAKIIAGQQQYSSFQTVMTGLSDTAKENKQSFEDYTEALLNCDGAASEMAETMADNLQGDLKKMESAYQDLQLSIYDGVNTPLREVVQTITGAVLPAFSNLVNGVDGADKEVGKAVGGLISTILNKTTSLLPTLFTVFSSIRTAVIQNLPQTFDGIIQAVLLMMESLIDIVPDILPALSESFQKIFSLLFSNIGNFSGLAAELIQVIGENILNELPKIGNTIIKIVKILTQDLIPAFSKQFPELLKTILGLITENLPTLLARLKKAVQYLLSGLKPILSELIPELLKVIVQFLNEEIPMLLNAAADLFGTILDALPDLITALAETLPDIITTIIDCLLTNIPVVLDTATALLMAIVDALPQILEALTTALPQIVEKLIDFFTSEDNLQKILDSAFTLLSAMLDCIP
ncbi:MAG: phage tail tape measure protein, partial [Oscillospiraceae bacterium]|nr:phage tail tape measure protein [Oscillospiraceae bacterium]